MTTSRKLPLSYNSSTYHSGGGKDYTSLQTWEEEKDIDLVSANNGEILDVYAGAHNDSENLDGANCDSDYFRVVRAASGEGHSGIPKVDGSVAAFVATGTGSSNQVLGIPETYSQIHDLVIKCNVNEGGWSYIAFLTGNETKIIGCLLIDCHNAGVGQASGIRAAGSPSYVINCLSFNADYSDFYGSAGTVYIYNTTLPLTDATRSFVVGSGATVNSKNCIIDGSIDDGDGTHNQTTNITTTPTYVASGSDDYHLHADDVTAKDNGTGLSGDGNFAFDDDIDGDTRSGDWDIGFDEFVAAGETVTFTGVDALTFTGKVIALADAPQLTKAALALTGKAMSPAHGFLLAKAATIFTGKALFLADAPQLAKATLAFTGKALFMNEVFITVKAALTFTGKTFTALTTGLVVLTKATLTFTGKTLYSNVTYSLTKATLAFTGKALTVSIDEILSLTKATLAFTGKVLYLNEAFNLVKFAVTFGGRATGIIGGAVALAARGLSKLGLSTRLE